MTRNKTRGFILLEVLLGVVIVSVSLTLIIQSMTSSLKAAEYASDYTTACFLIEDKLNEFMQTQTIPANLNESGQCVEPHEKYHYVLTTERINLTDIPDDIDPLVEKINQVNFQMLWKRGHAEKKVDVVTYLFDQK